MPNAIKKESDNHASSVAQYIEPATILTLSVAAVYLIGWSYMGGYFHRIGIQPTSLDLSIIYYLERGSGTIITVWLIVGCLFIGAASNKLKWLLRGLPLLLIFAWSSFVLLTSSSYRPHIVIIAIVEAVVVGLPMLLINPDKIIESIPNTPGARVILAVFLYAILIFGARFAGGYIGKKAVEGKSYGSLRIVFIWRDSPPPEVQDKELILIIHNGGKYYVVKKEDPASESPEVYIIPDDLVKYASLRRIN
jgi:hypothetical protein